MSRYDLPSIRAAWWAVRAVRSARRSVRLGDVSGERLPRAPAVGSHAGHAVRGVLRRRPSTCLVRALVLQRWYASQGQPRALVIGVTAPQHGFRAHAWLESDPPCHHEGFVELFRRPAL